MTKSALRVKRKLCRSCGLPIKPDELVVTPYGHEVHQLCWDLLMAPVGGKEEIQRAMAYCGFKEARPGVWIRTGGEPAQ